jgi:hypothetical protein
MEELIYFFVRIVCIGYLLYSVYGWRRRIETVCTLLYGKPCVKKEKKETVVTESAVSDTEVMGSTRYVYLDENAGKTAASHLKGILSVRRKMCSKKMWNATFSWIR